MCGLECITGSRNSRKIKLIIQDYSRMFLVLSYILGFVYIYMGSPKMI